MFIACIDSLAPVSKVYSNCPVLEDRMVCCKQRQHDGCVRPWPCSVGLDSSRSFGSPPYRKPTRQGSAVFILGPTTSSWPVDHLFSSRFLPPFSTPLSPFHVTMLFFSISPPFSFFSPRVLCLIILGNTKLVITVGSLADKLACDNRISQRELYVS